MQFNILIVFPLSFSGVRHVTHQGPDSSNLLIIHEIFIQSGLCSASRASGLMHRLYTRSHQLKHEYLISDETLDLDALSRTGEQFILSKIINRLGTKAFA